MLADADLQRAARGLGEAIRDENGGAAAAELIERAVGTGSTSRAGRSATSGASRGILEEAGA